MSLWDTYKQGAQVMQRYDADLAQRKATPTPASAKVGDTLGKHKGLLLALGVGLAAVVVLTRQKPAPVPKAEPEATGHRKHASEMWRTLV